MKGPALSGRVLRDLPGGAVAAVCASTGEAMASYLGSIVGVWKPLKSTRRAASPPCLHSHLVARRCPSPPPVSEDDARSFCSSLTEDLRALERSLGDGSVSLRWSADAMQVLKRMQAELLALFRRSGLPIPFGAKEGWLDQYMEETAVLLDLCNHLRSVASGISRYRMVVDLAVDKIQNGTRLEFEELEAEHKKLLEATRLRETTTTTTPDDAASPPPEQIMCDKSATGVAMLAAKCATVAISVMLVSTFVSPVSVDVGEEQISREFPQLGPLAASLASLVGRFRERCGGGGGPGVVLVEHEMVRDSVRDLRWQMEWGRADDGEELGRSVELLRQRSVGLKEGIEVFDAAVDEVFDEMIKGRNELLGSFRDGALK